MSIPMRCEPALPPALFAGVRRRAIFECCKWDPQVEDVSVLTPYPLILPGPEWERLSRAAEALYHETLAIERAFLQRPRLQSELGLPRRALRILASCDAGHADAGWRIMRFDFHPTGAGWRVSEVNSDVPGGYVETSGFAGLMAAAFPRFQRAGDPAQALADAIVRRLAPDARIALVHATAYVDDRSAMEYLARRFEADGLRTYHAAPDALTWNDGRAAMMNSGAPIELDFILRFYPAEWLPNLPRRCAWQNFFHRTRTPVSNPATALLTQSKRWPLFWDELNLDLPVWRELLPESRPVRDVLRAADADDWVLKPALGRVGDGVGIAGVTPPAEWKKITRAARWFDRHWVAQRRFDALPLQTPDGPAYPCIGVFVIDGAVAGAYGRIASRPLIDARARDIAVLIEPLPAAQAVVRVQSHAAA